MPRFYFNVCDGVSPSDTEGMELPDQKSAGREAVSFAGSILKDEAAHVMARDDWHLDVADDAGLVVFRINVSFHRPVAVGTNTRPN